jgi:hypothetical protein
MSNNDNIKSKNICFLYTETNGLHELNEDVIKKNLYGFARLVSLNYEIGYLENNKFISSIKKRIIIKPRCMFITDESINIHGITNEFAEENGNDIEEILSNFMTDLKNVSIIVSHNIIFHIRTVQAECIRYNLPNDFTKFIIIDTINFFHSYSFPKLKDLYENICTTDDTKQKAGEKEEELKKEKKSKKSKTKLNVEPKSNLELIRLCFFKLYSDYEKSII